MHESAWNVHYNTYMACVGKHSLLTLIMDILFQGRVSVKLTNV